MALNAVTIAAIVAACWAHPQGQAYLAKIDQIGALSISCGNPCCAQPATGGRVIHRPVFLSPTPARPTGPIEDDEALLLAILM